VAPSGSNAREAGRHVPRRSVRRARRTSSRREVVPFRARWERRGSARFASHLAEPRGWAGARVARAVQGSTSRECEASPRGPARLAALKGEDVDAAVPTPPEREEPGGRLRQEPGAPRSATRSGTSSRLAAAPAVEAGSARVRIEPKRARPRARARRRALGAVLPAPLAGCAGSAHGGGPGTPGRPAPQSRSSPRATRTARPFIPRDRPDRSTDPGRREAARQEARLQRAPTPSPRPPPAPARGTTAGCAPPADPGAAPTARSPPPGCPPES